MLVTGDPSLHSSCVPCREKGRQGQRILSHEHSVSQMTELSWKDVINALSLANMVLGLFSIFCSFSRKSHCASWMLLISFLLDMAIGTMTRYLNICHKLAGLELNDFAVFTTFGLASALLLGVDGPLNGFLAVIYVLTTSFRLCFYSTGGGPSAYKGLPCPYASCVLASTCLLTKGNTFILCCMASLMILFMIDQSCYPHDEILESENWKKVVYMGGKVIRDSNRYPLPSRYRVPDSRSGCSTQIRCYHAVYLSILTHRLLLPDLVALLHLLSRCPVGQRSLY
ncbi:transmembrane protein 269 isoform X3 [Mesocricetus auratus]|nr:transmembrane protein 269 isoform X3 [Mesocricetus auratus]XP_040612726.1 transmembrane protein 269 isoform X3 [Mesocricetus auratus]XP_040612727.1 transmembrane protein 269 isoform X3 [Mesocricetus auratus]